MQCVRDNGRLIISELTIGLNGDITPQSSLADLIAAAAPTKTECPAASSMWPVSNDAAVNHCRERVTTLCIAP